MNKVQMLETEIEGYKSEIVDLRGAIETYRVHIHDKTRAVEVRKTSSYMPVEVFSSSQ